MTVLDAVARVLLEGGAAGVGLIGWAAWWYERKLNREAFSKLLELATAQIEATLKHEVALEANTKLMQRMLNR